MLGTALRAFATFFATIGPVEAAVLFATFCPRFSRAERVAISFKAVGIATGIILFFALFGTAILAALGVTFPALQAAGASLDECMQFVQEALRTGSDAQQICGQWVRVLREFPENHGNRPGRAVR